MIEWKFFLPKIFRRKMSIHQVWGWEPWDFLRGFLGRGKWRLVDKCTRLPEFRTGDNVFAYIKLESWWTKINDCYLRLKSRYFPRKEIRKFQYLLNYTLNIKWRSFGRNKYHWNEDVSGATTQSLNARNFRCYLSFGIRQLRAGLWNKCGKVKM